MLIIQHQTTPATAAAAAAAAAADRCHIRESSSPESRSPQDVYHEDGRSFRLDENGRSPLSLPLLPLLLNTSRGVRTDALTSAYIRVRNWYGPWVSTRDYLVKRPDNR